MLRALLRPEDQTWSCAPNMAGSWYADSLGAGGLKDSESRPPPHLPQALPSSLAHKADDPQGGGDWNALGSLIHHHFEAPWWQVDGVRVERHYLEVAGCPWLAGVLEFPLLGEPPGQQRKHADLHVKPRRCTGSI